MASGLSHRRPPEGQRCKRGVGGGGDTQMEGAAGPLRGATVEPRGGEGETGEGVASSKEVAWFRHGDVVDAAVECTDLRGAGWVQAWTLEGWPQGFFLGPEGVRNH